MISADVFYPSISVVVIYLLSSSVQHFPGIKKLITTTKGTKEVYTDKVVLVVASHYPAAAFKLQFCSYKHVGYLFRRI